MGWEKVKLGDILHRSKIPLLIEDNEQYKRVTIKTKHQGVSLRDIEKGKKIGTKKQFVLKKGQFILSKIDARYGAFGIAPEEVDGAIITGNFWAYDVDFERINIKWLNNYTNSKGFYELCERASSGITHRKYLSEAFFLDHEIYLPDKVTQDYVLKDLESNKQSINNLGSEIEDQLDLLKNLRQQILQDAVMGKLVEQDPEDEPASVLLEKTANEKQKLISEGKIKKSKPLPEITEEEKPFEIPSSWGWCRLNDICTNLIDCPHSTPKYVENDTGFYGIDTNCIDDKGKITRLRPLPEDSYHERIKRLVPKANDIVYAREGSIGKATFIPDNKNICLGQRVMLFRASSEISVHFLMLLVTEEKYKQRLLAKHKGIGAKHVNVKDIVASLTPLPPLNEQHRIVAKVKQLIKICDDLEQSIQQNQKYTQDLLQVALKETLEPKQK